MKRGGEEMKFTIWPFKRKVNRQPKILQGEMSNGTI